MSVPGNPTGSGIMQPAGLSFNTGLFQTACAIDDHRDADCHLDGYDNCPLDDNETQADADGDGIGDECDFGNVEDRTCYSILAVNNAVVTFCL